MDRLGWAAGSSWRLFGLRVGVRTNSAAALEMLAAQLPCGATATAAATVDRLYSVALHAPDSDAGVRRFHLLYGDIVRIARTLDRYEVLAGFQQDLNLYVAEHARTRTIVHAGVVGWRGRAIVLPGLTFAGKTTLVAALVRAGATYYSDDWAVLDRHGRVHPHPRPLGIRDSSARQTPSTIATIGGRAGTRAIPVGLVVACPYISGATWRPRALSAGQGVLELVKHTVSVRRYPERALSALQRVTARAPVIRGLRGEADRAADWILARADRLGAALRPTRSRAISPEESR